MLERTCSIALRILDNRWLSLCGRFLAWNDGVAVVLITAGLVVAAIGFLTRIGVVPLVFIGLGVFLLLAGGTSRLRARLAGRVAPDTALARPRSSPTWVATYSLRFGGPSGTRSVSG